MNAATIGLSSAFPPQQTHPPLETRPVTGQRTLIVAAVTLAHIGGLWALHNGLLRRAVEVVRPETIMVQLIEPAQNAIVASPSFAATPAVQRQPTTRQVTSATSPTQPSLTEPRLAPMPEPNRSPATQAPSSATPDPAGTESAQSANVQQPQNEQASPMNLETTATVVAKKKTGNSPPNHCGNKKPSYPGMSSRLGEQGTVLVRVWVESNGSVSNADVLKSSGFERLDRAALTSVRTWRFEPGLQEGVPTGMPVHIPISFGQTENTTENVSPITCQ